MQLLTFMAGSWVREWQFWEKRKEKEIYIVIHIKVPHSRSLSDWSHNSKQQKTQCPMLIRSSVLLENTMRDVKKKWCNVRIRHSIACAQGKRFSSCYSQTEQSLTSSGTACIPEVAASNKQTPWCELQLWASQKPAREFISAYLAFLQCAKWSER
jgi:hypothetical protein